MTRVLPDLPSMVEVIGLRSSICLPHLRHDPGEGAWWLDERTKRLIEHGLVLEEEWSVTVACESGVPERLSRNKVLARPEQLHQPLRDPAMTAAGLGRGHGQSQGQGDSKDANCQADRQLRSRAAAASSLPVHSNAPPLQRLAACARQPTHLLRED